MFGTRPFLRWAFAVALGVIAYRELLRWLVLPGSDAHGLTSLMFDASTPPVVAVAIAAALAARGTLPLTGRSTSQAHVVGGVALFAGTLAHAWAIFVGAPDILLYSVAACGLGLALLGGRRCLGPLAVLALAVPWPAPLTNGLIWWLQLATTRAAGWLVEASGLTVLREGISLVGADRSLLVIESCSGLGTIRVFILIAVAFSAYVRPAPVRVFALLMVAPLIAFGLNAVRVALLYAAERESSDPTHAVQGVAVFALGALLLAATDSLVSRLTRRPQPPPVGPERRRPYPSAVGLAVLSGLALMSVLVPRFDAAPLRDAWSVDIPPSFEGAKSEALAVDPHFWGDTSFTSHFLQKYAAANGAIFLLLAHDDLSRPDRSLWSLKHAMPGARWELVGSREYMAPGGERFTVTLSQHGNDRALTAHRLSEDEMSWAGAMRSLLALDQSPHLRPAGVTLTKVIAEIRPGPGGREAAWLRLRSMLEHVQPLR